MTPQVPQRPARTAAVPAQPAGRDGTVHLTVVTTVSVAYRREVLDTALGLVESLNGHVNPTGGHVGPADEPDTGPPADAAVGSA